MRRLLNVLNSVPLFLNVTPGVRQVHLAERASTDLALNDKRFAQFAKRFVLSC